MRLFGATAVAAFAGPGVVYAQVAAKPADQARSQGLSAEDAAQLRAEIAALKAQVGKLEARLDAASPGSASAAAAPAGSVPTGASSASGAPIQQAAATPAAQPDFKVTWKGGPEISTASGWSFKPRGRLQFDSGTVSTPTLQGTAQKETGFATELRRAYLGAQGTIPGGFGYRVDVDFAPSSQEFTDTYITWDHKAWNVTVGQHFPFLSLDQMTSDLDTSMLERAAFNTAFNFERRVGLSAGYAKGDIMINGGVFTDNLLDLSSDADNAYSFDGRVVWMPKWGNTQFHLAASGHWRRQNDQGDVAVRYRSRPYTHITDLRFVDTRNLSVDKELNYGVEAAAISGPFHFAAEANWLRPTLTNGVEPTFFGGYAEVGYFITSGDSRPYKKGAWGAIKPAKAITNGGPGAIQVNLRYDRLDLGDAGIQGGSQDSYLASLVWVPVEHIKLMGNYGHLVFKDSALPILDTTGDYAADMFTMRAQVDF
ncbi:MAG TPA: porin [Sphingobium sp.]